MLLNKLIEASAVSGQEEEVRKIIIEELKDHVDSIESDKIGNIIVYKKGKSEKKKILISAAMDEIGGIVNKINSDGTLKFTKAGFFDERILVSKIVNIGKNSLKGVIGAKPIHLQKADERKKALSINQLYVDIGVSSKEEAAKLVEIGDYISICSETKDFNQNDIIKGKALDSRIPCHMLIELLKSDLDYSIYGAFTVMDKVMIFGSRCVGARINPDYTIVLDGTDNKLGTTELGKGPIINLKEIRAVFDRDFVNTVIDIADKKDIELQISTDENRITGADLYQIASEGSKVIKLSVPCKYVGTPVNLVSRKDIKALNKLINEIISVLGGNYSV
ncbi:MAG: M42 family peptidase [Andreesenia angusta]|nr:M42 family peptidase [Andreesenia angusta]